MPVGFILLHHAGAVATLLIYFFPCLIGIRKLLSPLNPLTSLTILSVDFQIKCFFSSAIFNQELLY